MKPLLTTLSVVTLATTTGSLNNILHTTLQKSNISTNAIDTKTEQDTKYIDIYRKEISTNKTDLWLLDSKEITQIGFYQNEKGEIQAVQMPKIVEKIPNKLPHEIISLENMFTNAIVFNQDLSQWDTSNIKNMKETFFGTEKFNQDLSSWKTDIVTDMSGMFFGAVLFNQDLSKWNVAKVTDMTFMFAGTYEFNQDISQWNIAKVKAMSFMFYNAILFNQDISKWNTENVTEMNGMFYNAKKFNQNLSGWNVTNVTEHENFNEYSGFENDTDKLPKFKK